MNQREEKENQMNDIEKNLLSAVTGLRDTLKNGDRLQDKLTMRRVELQLEPQQLGAEDVKALREQFNTSQAVFAMLIGVSPSALKAWEQGAQNPPAWASRLLAVMKDYPKPWREILDDSATRHENCCNS